MPIIPFRSRAARLVPAAVLIATAGCAALGAAPAAPHVSSADRDARLALGPVDDLLIPAEDPRPRLRALRDLSARLGNADEAEAAAGAVIQLSRQRLALARDLGGDVGAATRELDGDREAAVALADRAGSPRQLAAALDGVDAGHRLAAHYLRVLELDGWLSGAQLAVARAVARTPLDRARIERTSRQPEQALDALAALGPAVLDVLDLRLVDALDADDLAGAVQVAGAIVAIDPLDVDARLLIAYDADRAAGRLTADLGVARAIVGAGSDVATQQVALVEHARRSAPTASSLALGAAWVLVHAGLPGDAWSRLADSVATDRVELRNDLRGLLALDAGALAVYRTWRAGRGGLASPSVATYELRYFDSEVAIVQREVAGEAAARVIDAGWRVLRRAPAWRLAHDVAMDDRASRRVRERALVRVADVGARAVLRHCLDQRLPRLACARLRDAIDDVTSEDPEDLVGSVERLATVPGAGASWLPAAAWGLLDDLRALTPRIAALEPTAVGLTEQWTATAMLAAVARGDRAEVQRLLAERGALLAPLGLAAAHLAVGDLAAGRDPDEVADALARSILRPWPVVNAPTADRAAWQGLDDDEADDPPDGDTAALGHALGWSTDAADAAATLAGLRRAHPEPALAALDVMAAVFAAAADDPAARAAALPDGVPERDLVIALLGRRDLAATRAALARFLARRVSQGWPRFAYVATGAGDRQRSAGAADLGLAAARDDLAVAIDRGGDRWRLIAGGFGDRDRQFVTALLDTRERELIDAPAGEIRARAAAAAEHARATGIDDARRRAWLALIAGDVAEAERLATTPTEWSRGEPPLAVHHPVRRLLADRARLPDELIRDLWRLTTRPRDPIDRDAIVAALLAVDGAGPGTAAVACRLLVDADQHARALAPCWSAWRGGVADDDDLAVALTWLIINLPDEAAGHGIVAATAMAEVAARRAASDDAVLWDNLAVFHARQGDHARADEHRQRADRFGASREDATVYYREMQRARAPVLRAVVAERRDADRAGLIELGRLALFGGDLAGARWYVAAAGARRAGGDAAARSLDERFEDIVALAASDVAAGALTAADAAVWLRGAWGIEATPDGFVARHPRSALVALGALDAVPPDRRAAVAAELLARVPDNRLAVATTTSIMAALGRRDDAAAALARARARHPDSALLAEVALAGDPAQTRWLADADAFAAALAAVTPAQLVALDPERIVIGAAEVFVPRARTGADGKFQYAGLGLFVGEAPNPTRCAPSDCLDGQLPSPDAGWRQRWRRELVLAGAPAAQALLDGPQMPVLFTLAPRGGRLFHTAAGVPATVRADVAQPVVRLVLDSLQPLDLQVPADRAEALRADARLPADAVRLAARRATAGGTGCAWIPAGLAADQRAGLLLDLALLDRDRLARAVACAGPGDGEAAAALAALALVSDHAPAAAYGRAVAAAHPAAVMQAARTLFAPGGTQASTPDDPFEVRARRGWLQIAAALPDAERERLVADLLASATPAEHAAGIAIAGVLPTAATRGRLREQITRAPADLAQLAVVALAAPLDAADLAALRTRADRAPATLDATDRRLLTTLMTALTRAGDGADRARVARLARRLGGEVPTAPPPPLRGPGTPVGDADLTGRPLAALLDGGAWAYARAPQPAALVASARELFGRLQIGGTTEQYVLATMVKASTTGPFALLGPDGGLDLSRPLECASLAGEHVCVAAVADRAAVERVLDARPDAVAGVRLPELTAMVGAGLGMVAGAGPLLTRWAFAPPGEDDPLGFGAMSGSEVLRERARLTTTVAGRALIRHVEVTARSNGRSELADPAVVIVGDRLFVFSSPAMAARVLTDLPAPGAALADDPTFRAVAATWTDGVAIQGLMEDHGRDRATFEVGPEAAGLRFRMRTTATRKPSTPVPAATLLPPGASAIIAYGALPAPGGDDRGYLRTALGDLHWLFDTGRDFAFGWYPVAGVDEEAWVMAVRWSPALARQAARRGFTRLGAGGVEQVGALHAGRAGDYLVIGTRADLVGRAAAQRPVADGRILVSQLDGVALAASVRRRPPPAGERAAIPVLLGLGAELVGRVEATGRKVGRDEVIEGVIRPQLAAPGDARAVIDRWLATPTLRNNTRLPRRLTDDEVEQPLVFTFEVADAAAVASRLFPTTSRTTVSVLDERRVRVAVSPAPALGDRITAAPLAAAARARALADDGDVRARHARIQQVARDLVPAGTKPADAARRVGAWVHKTLRYQVTAEGGDAVAILDRGSGDCTEYSLLTVAILRAAGVPAETRSGIAAGDGELVAHAWVAFHDGTGWREIDPTWGRDSVGADHLETSILDYVALVSLDQLTVSAVETVAPAAPAAP